MAKVKDPTEEAQIPAPTMHQPTVPAAWNPEDLALLATEQEQLGRNLLELKETLDPLLTRFAKIEADVAILDPSRSLLPSEIVKGLAPAEVYKSVLNAGLTALLMGEPHLVNDAKFRIERINRILDLCDTVMDCVSVRAGTNLKK